MTSGDIVLIKGTIGPRMLVESTWGAFSLLGFPLILSQVVYEWNGRFIRLEVNSNSLEVVGHAVS